MNQKMESLLENIKESTKNIKIIPVDNNIVNGIFDTFKINTESLLGTVISNSGEIIVDNWIRIYGAGKTGFLQRNLDFPYRNILIAEDISGGLFAFMDNGRTGYFAPDTLEWENMEINYSQFLYWCIHGDTDAYYKDYRWNTWEDDTPNLSIENGFAFYPFLWAESKSLEERTHTEMPMEEIIKFELQEK